LATFVKRLAKIQIQRWISKPRFLGVFLEGKSMLSPAYNSELRARLAGRGSYLKFFRYSVLQIKNTFLSKAP